jgi:SNF family Na+-dependent transporter
MNMNGFDFSKGDSFGSMIGVVFAGIAIFPALFAYGISPASGEALPFIVLTGITASLSIGLTSGVKLFSLNNFDLFNTATANILLPPGRLLIVLSSGWFSPGQDVREKLSGGGSLKAGYYPVYRFILRFVAPIAITIVFLNRIGLMKF